MLRSRRALLSLMMPVALAACSDGPAAPPVEEKGHVFTYSPPAHAPAVASISVRGSFNGWEEQPMKRNADGSWQAVVDLAPGAYEYKFYINGSWVPDMCHDRSWGHADRDYAVDLRADGCVSDGFSGQNAVVTFGDVGPGFSHSPTNPAHVSAAGGRLSVRFRVRPAQVHAASVIVGRDTFPMHAQVQFGVQEVWRAAVPEATTTYTVSLRTRDGAQSYGPYTVPAALFRAVPWVGGSVGYQIFPERFWNGDPTNDHWTLKTDVVNYMNPKHWRNQPVLMDTWGGEMLPFHCCHQYYGGDLQGIIDRLDHLQSLGVTLVYLNPIFIAGSAHGYDTYDYMKIAPSFGDEQTLHRLVETARARGIRLMWDFVPNHVGVGHWAFQDAVKNGEASPYWRWFNFKVPGGQVEVGHGGHYEGWWGFGSLPRLETRNPQVLQHLLEVTRYWTRFGLDGIRVDVPGEIRNRNDFFTAFRQAAKAINPEVYLIGEIWQRDPSWLQGDQFDALMNYALGEGVVERFANGGLTASAAAQEMARLFADYPEASAAMQFNLISSHDTGRLLTKLGGGGLGATPNATALARQRLASAILYAVPGVPVTFQGDECAFLGTGDGPRQENRYPLQWQACDRDMLAHYRGLGELKKALPALGSPVIRSPRGAGSLLVFHRGEPGVSEVLAVFNGAQAAQSLALPAGSWTDAVSGQIFAGSVDLGPLGWRYLRRS